MSYYINVILSVPPAFLPAINAFTYDRGRTAEFTVTLPGECGTVCLGSYNHYDWESFVRQVRELPIPLYDRQSVQMWLRGESDDVYWELAIWTPEELAASREAALWNYHF